MRGSRGLPFATVPLSFPLLAFMPFLGVGPFGIELGAGWLPIAVELFRDARFGLSLGISYALLRAERREPLKRWAVGAA